MNNAQRQQLLDCLDEYLTYSGYLCLEDARLRGLLDNACIMDPSFYSEDMVPNARAIDIFRALPCSFKISTVLGRSGFDDFDKAHARSHFILSEAHTLTPSGRDHVCRFAQPLLKERPDIVVQYSFSLFDEHAEGMSKLIYYGFNRAYTRMIRFEPVLADPNDSKSAITPAPSLSIDSGVGKTQHHLFMSTLGFETLLPAYWLAKISCAGSPAVTFLTDPTGIQDLFKFRDKLPSQVRRPQLLHWVGEHYRQHRDAPNVEVLVRKHLRGQRTFTHGELSVRIEESMRDEITVLDAIEEREQLKRQRAAWRKRRK
jgi:hypothetical protein